MDREERLKKAVALRYDGAEDSVPRVVAAGRGEVADKIIATAREAGVPVHRDARLAEMLSQLDLGAAIPVELYKMVAEVLIFIYALDQKALPGGSFPRRGPGVEADRAGQSWS